jgi:hypothetical protein
LGPKCLNLGLISFHIVSMFFKTNNQFLFVGWGIHVFRHFLTSHTKTSLSPNKPLNNKSTMGFKLGIMVDDQMLMSIITQLWELLRCKLTSLFPHFYGRISGCHYFPDFTWMVSHNKPFTSRTMRWHSMCIVRGMSWHETMQMPVGK